MYLHTKRGYKMSFKKIYLLIISACIFSISSFADNYENLIIKTRKSVVKITARASIDPTGNPGNWNGSGFISNKEKGLIITNAHVVGKNAVATYDITFYTGQQAKANLVYCDQWQDFALLQVDPNTIPLDSEAIKVSNKIGKLNEKVYVVGNTEGQDFSMHSGFISTLYEISGEMPQDTYVVNLNISGGASGSPLLTEKGEAIGLVYGGGKTYGLALKGSYLVDAISAINAGREPKRQHVGVISDLYSLDKAIKHRKFPKSVMEKYMREFPDARNKAIVVLYNIPGTPAESFFKAGDIIWEVDDVKIGSGLYELDKALDKSRSGQVNVKVYRDGKIVTGEVKTYDINKHRITEILEIAGGYFYHADDFIAAKRGVKLGSLALTNVKEGSSLSVIPYAWYHGQSRKYMLMPTKINDMPVKNLRDLESVIGKAIENKYVKFDFFNYQPYIENFNSNLNSVQTDLTFDVELDNIDAEPRRIYFDKSTNEWKSELLKK